MSGADRSGKVGFAGMGVMGGGMAASLLKSGFTVVGYDANPKRNDHMATLGAIFAKALGLGKEDGSAGVKLYEQWAGVTPAPEE